MNQIYTCDKCKQQYQITQPGEYQCQCGEKFTIAPMPQCPFCKSEVDLDALKCPNCGEWIKQKPAQPVSVQNQESKQPKSKKIIKIIFVCLAIFIFAPVFMIPFIFLLGQDPKFCLIPIGLIIFVLLCYKVHKNDMKRKYTIICPNPNCGFRGMGIPDGGRNGCLLIILLCAGVLPGILYILCTGKPGVKCPRCGIKAR